MRLKHEKGDDDKQYARKGQNAVPERGHPAAQTADERGEREDNCKLCKLRRLHREPADAEPAPRAVRLDADDRHQKQQHEHRPEKHEGIAPVKPHRQARREKHRPDAEKRKQKLAHEVIRRVAAGYIAGVIVGAGIA